jgi:hypothetical protein
MPAKKPVEKTTASLKKSGVEKLTKIGKTTSEAHILSALRQGKITKQEAAAIDPKKFKILLAPATSSKTITLRGGAGAGGMFGTKNR